MINQRLNSMVHIVGLTLGLCVCIVILLFIRYEVTFDRQHDQYERIFRVNMVWNDGAKKNLMYSTPVPLAEVLRKEGTGFEKVVFVHPHADAVVNVTPTKIFSEDKVLIVSPEFLEVFKVETVSGDPKKALDKPYQALLTETTARKYFGDEPALGKTFRYKNEFDITVGAVIKDFPGNTHLQAGMLLSFVPIEGFLQAGLNQWGMVSGSSTFFLLKPGTSLGSIQEHLNTIANQYINSDPGLPSHVRSGFDIIPLSDIHFKPEYGGGPWGGAIDSGWLWIFGSIGVAVLFLACINFVNLSTAQAMTRGKEVGVRKSVGAGRSQLILQFMVEAWLLALISGILALALVPLLLPSVNNLLQKQIVFDLVSSPFAWIIFLAGIVVIGLLAGIYPAWVSTRFQPSVVLKSNSGDIGRSGSGWLKSTLMITQFVISVGLLAGVLLIGKQVQFLRSKSLGFDKENIVSIPIPFGQWQKFYGQLQDLGQIQNYSFSSATPTATGHWGTVMSLNGMDDPERKNVTLVLADHQFVPMYDLKLVSGRYHLPSDSSYISNSIPQENQLMKVVVNEKLVSELGFTSAEAAIGERFWFGMNSGNGEIIGVVKDFNTTSLHVDINTVIIAMIPSGFNQVGIKLNAGTNLPDFLAEIDKRWKAIFPHEVFEYRFLDHVIDSLYATEERVFKLFQILSGVAMLISCLGLWGFTSFTLQRKNKEVGVRKVLGASVAQIVFQLSSEFIWMVCFAMIIAFPVVYFFTDEWLTQFAFRMDIQVGPFLGAGLLSILVALITISYQAIKIAITNPVKSLRTD